MFLFYSFQSFLFVHYVMDVIIEEKKPKSEIIVPKVGHIVTDNNLHFRFE